MRLDITWLRTEAQAHLNRLHAGLTRCGDDGVKVGLGHGARLLGIDVLAAFHTRNRVSRLLTAQWGACCASFIQPALHNSHTPSQ
jgi:hypothetical protein